MRKKKMEDKDKRLDLDKPEEAVSDDPEKEVEEESEEAPADEVVEAPEDRGAYNCADCSGEGLLATGAVCGKCLGTGKI